MSDNIQKMKLLRYEQDTIVADFLDTYKLTGRGERSSTLGFSF